MPVLLFDIDGTLVRSGGAGKVAMETALRETFGLDVVLDGVPYSGRTDRSIARDLLALHGLDVTPEQERRLMSAYLEGLPAALRDSDGVVCPGIAETLTKAKNAPGVLLGLLTGNVRHGARTKLDHFALWDFFPTGGGFGDDHYDRDDVAHAAIRELAAHRKGHHGDEVWVIGDTPLDVACARAIGAKSVAVATGWHSFDELAACNPDEVFRDLTEAEELIGRWLR